MEKTLKFSSVVTIIVGTVFIVGGIWGMYFTYRSVVQENIITPADASMANKPVRGPFTLKAQADIIREHTRNTTGGKTFAEMPRQVPKRDESGNQVFDEEGKPVMEANTAREKWIPATTLITALNVGILAYAFSGLSLLLGLVLVCIGVVLCTLNKLQKVASFPYQEK